MPRIRTTKPEFWSDEKIAPLDPLTRLVFLGLISLADDAGRLIDNVKSIDGFIFPATDDSARDALDVLASLSRISRYVLASGQRVIQISNWEKHQKVDRPSRYVLPAENSREARETVAQVQRSDLGPRTLDLGPRTLDPQPAREDLASNGTAPLADGSLGKTAELSEPLKAPTPTDDPYAAAWREAFGGEMPRGRSRREIAALELEHGPTETLARWRRYLATTSAQFASTMRFAAGWGEWQETAKSSAIAPDSSETNDPASLWQVYVAHGLLSQWPRGEYARIGAELVAEGLYPSVEAFIGEISITEPWTLNTSRMTDATAARVIGDRLRAANKRAAARSHEVAQP